LFLIFGTLIASIPGCSNRAINAPESFSTHNTVSQGNENSAIPTPTPGSNPQIATILENRRLWESSKIENYDMLASLYVGGVKAWPEPVLIKVRRGSAIAIESEFGSEEELIKGYRDFDTIAKIFALLELEAKSGAKVEVKYNHKFGYPAEVYIDHYLKGSDHYKRLVVRQLKRIEP